jgi:hypothetical protein
MRSLPPKTSNSLADTAKPIHQGCFEARTTAQPRGITLLGATLYRRRRRHVWTTWKTRPVRPSTLRIDRPSHRVTPSARRGKGSQLAGDATVVTAEVVSAQASNAYKTRKENGHGKYPRGIELGKPTLRRLWASVTSSKHPKTSPLRPPPRHRRREPCLPDLRSAKWAPVRFDQECWDRDTTQRRARGSSRCTQVARRSGRRTERFPAEAKRLLQVLLHDRLWLNVLGVRVLSELLARLSAT